MTQVTIKLRRGTALQWEQENPTLADGEVGIDLTSKLFKIGDGLTEWNNLDYAVTKGEDGAPGESGWAPRETKIFTTESLLPLHSEEQTIPLQAGYRLLKIQTDVPARVQIYDSEEKRTEDQFRPIGNDPTGNHGVILDFVTTESNLTWWLNPVVDGYTISGTISVPIRVINLSDHTSIVTVILTWTRSE